MTWRAGLGFLRPLLAFPAAVAVTLAATGWLYLVGPRLDLPGPYVADALPLDELAHASSVPLLLFVAVWGAAGALLGAVGRSTRLDRLTVGFLLSLSVGLLVYVATAVSIAVVRQIPAQHAFDRAAGLPVVYLAAALAGLGGALLARPRAAGTRAPLLLAATVAVAGLLELMRTVLPGSRGFTVSGLAPYGLVSVAAALGAPIGVALLFSARGLARRQQRAWTLAVALLGSALVLHVLHGFNDGGVLGAATLLALVALRRDFDRKGDPSGGARLFVRAGVSVAAITAFGIVAVWINRMSADRSYSVGFALRETLRSVFALDLTGSAHLDRPFGAWFPISVLMLTVAGIAWVLLAALAPWRYRHAQEARERELARALVATWGTDTLAPFVLRADKSYFFSPDERGFLAYKVVGGVAIVSGDPVGPAAVLDELVATFIVFARARGWRIAILGASGRLLELYRRHGLQALYHGDEAVLETASFSLEGRAIRKVRQSVQRLEREGYTVRLLHPRELPGDLRADLEAIASAWRGSEPQKGFVMALDSLFRLEDDDALFAIGFDARGRPAGFLHFACARAGSALSLSSMPRLRTTPNGFNEWLVCATVDWAREHGYARISLNFAPFAALLAPEADLRPAQRAQRRALLSLKGHFQLDNLLLFNRKFFPGWERRFVVYERRLDLPRVGLAALAAEAYLPTRKRREA